MRENVGKFKKKDFRGKPKNDNGRNLKK